MCQIKSIVKMNLLIVFGILIILIGCSSGGNKSNPVIPGHEILSPEFTEFEIRDGSETSNHILLGYNMIHVDASDPDNIKLEMVPVRLGEMHLNILSLLEGGLCSDCFKIVDFSILEPYLLSVDIEITHPLPDITYTLFDVRGIMMFNGSQVFPHSGLTMSNSDLGDSELLNADGYTTLYNGATYGLGSPLFTYDPGVISTQIIPNSDINGFKRYITDDAANTRNALYAGSSVTQNYLLQMSTAWTLVFGYAVDASWDIPAVDPVVDPMTDFSVEANCLEPWQVIISSEPILDDGETTLTIDVYDWQGSSTISSVRVECHELFTGNSEAVFIEEGLGYSTWEAIISNEQFAQIGFYDCLISVEDNANAMSPEYIDLTTREIYDVEVSTFRTGNLIWAKRAGGIEHDQGRCVTTLSDDSTVVTGTFRGEVIFGEGESNETVFTAVDGGDIFVIRNLPDGSLVWAKRTEGETNPSSLSITTLSDDSIVLTGILRSSMILGEGESNETVLSSVGDIDIFVARFNPDGTLAWAKSAGGEEDDLGNSVTTLSDNSIVLTGRFNISATFGMGELNETILTSGHEDDIFIARYNPDGSLAWVKQAGGEWYANIGRSIIGLSDDSTVVTGEFAISATFGIGESNETVLSSGYGIDIFIARYNPDGTLAWVKQAGGSGNVSSYASTALSDNSVVITGWATDPYVIFGYGEINQTITQEGGAFFARYHPDGTLDWVKMAWQTSITDITSLSNDMIVITGGASSIFIVCYYPDGDFVWEKIAVGVSDGYGSGITTLSDDSTILTGFFSKTRVFGVGEENETVLESAGNRDIFIARYAP